MENTTANTGNQTPETKPTFNKKVAKEIARELVKETLDAIIGINDDEHTFYTYGRYGHEQDDYIELALRNRGLNPTEIRTMSVGNHYDTYMAKIRAKAKVQFEKWHNSLR